jgi:hypothetical protein
MTLGFPRYRPLSPDQSPPPLDHTLQRPSWGTYIDNHLGICLKHQSKELTLQGCKVRNHLQHQGHILHDITDTPSSHILHLGNILTPDGALPSVSSILKSFVALLILFVSKFVSTNQSERIVGQLGWLTGHHKLGYPFLSPLHRHIACNNKIIQPQLKFSALKAFQLGIQSSDVGAFLLHKFQKHLGFIFLDANFTFGFGGLLQFSSSGTLVDHYQISCPKHVRNQQDFELFMVLVFLKFAIRKGIATVNVCADNIASIFSAKNLTCSIFLHSRQKIIKGISNLLSKHKIITNLGYIPSKANPADHLTHSLVHSSFEWSTVINEGSFWIHPPHLWTDTRDKLFDIQQSQK